MSSRKFFQTHLGRTDKWEKRMIKNGHKRPKEHETFQSPIHNVKQWDLFLVPVIPRSSDSLHLGNRVSRCCQGAHVPSALLLSIGTVCISQVIGILWLHQHLWLRSASCSISPWGRGVIPFPYAVLHLSCGIMEKMMSWYPWAKPPHWATDERRDNSLFCIHGWRWWGCVLNFLLRPSTPSAPAPCQIDVAVIVQAIKTLWLHQRFPSSHGHHHLWSSLKNWPYIHRDSCAWTGFAYGDQTSWFVWHCPRFQHSVPNCPAIWNKHTDIIYQNVQCSLLILLVAGPNLTTIFDTTTFRSQQHHIQHRFC